MAPTVVADVTPDMSIAREEVFGPVLSMLTFDTARRGRRARQSDRPTACPPASGAATSTRCQRGSRLRAGTVWVNTFMDGYAELPFGGFGESGLGRELGRHAALDYTEEKTFQLHSGPRTDWWVPRRESIRPAASMALD